MVIARKRGIAVSFKNFANRVNPLVTSKTIRVEKKSVFNVKTDLKPGDRIMWRASYGSDTGTFTKYRRNGNYGLQIWARWDGTGALGWLSPESVIVL